MSNIKVSTIDDEQTQTHEANNSAGTGEAPQGKPKRIRTKPQPTAQQPPPPPPPVEKQGKPGRMTTCVNCKKEMLEKTFKYYHQLKCLPKEKEAQNPPPTNPEAKPERKSVDFNFNRRAQQQQTQERYTNLMANAC